MSLSHRIAPFSVLLSVLLSSSSLSAQDARQPLFVDRVDVNIVNVEVWVTDDQGRRVQGLEKEDFELLEDGAPVEITNFYSTARPKPYMAMLEGATPSPAQQDEPSPDVPPDQRLHLVVLVDHFNTLPVNRNEALGELEPFLEDRVRQGDRVMLIGFDRSLDVVEPFTGNFEGIQRGLRELRKKPSSKPMLEAERRRRLREITIAWQIDPAEPNSAYDAVRAQVQQEEQTLRQTAKALENVLRSLAGMPGRKAILYLSDGLPKRPAEELYEQYGRLFGLTPDGGDPFVEALRQNQAPLLNRIAREANAQQVTLYTVDTRGTAGGSTLSSEFADLTPGIGGSASLGVGRTFNYQETLVDIANATGGSTVLNTTNYDQAIASVAEDFDVFYSLGYAARQGGDGGFHKIEVRVRQPGLKVRHRRGYVDKPQEERIADRTLSSLILDMEKNPLEVEIDFGTPEKQSRRAYHLPVLIRMPLRHLTLLPNGEVEQGSLRIYLAVKDDGGVSDMQEFSYPIEVPVGTAASANQEVGYTALLRIGPGKPTIAVGVWDEISGTDAFVHRQVLIGPDRN